MAEFNNPFADPTENSNPFDDPSVQQARTAQATGGGVTASSGGSKAGPPDDFNPFDRQAGSKQQQQQQQQPQRPAVLPSQNPPPYTASPQQRVSSDELERRQRELEAKARELERREEEQRRREQQNPATGSTNNWPPTPSFCPIGPCFYQDFEVEIPQEFRRLVRFAYYLWIAHAVVLLLNIIGTMAYFISSAPNHGTVAGPVFGVSMLVAFVFVPCSFVCWFRPLYKAFRSDSSFNYFLFFVIFFIQFVIVVIQLLGIDYLGSCGWINGLAMLKTNTIAAGIMLFISACFTALAIIDGILLIRVHRIYRNSGASFNKAREEFSRGVLTNETVRGAAADAATASARSAFSGSAGRY